jgi:hypothetical protein
MSGRRVLLKSSSGCCKAHAWKSLRAGSRRDEKMVSRFTFIVGMESPNEIRDESNLALKHGNDRRERIKY